MMSSVRGFDSKERLLASVARGRNVLHLGAVGCTLGTSEEKVAFGERSIHGLLTRISTCVGVDSDAAGVAALTDAGIFDNLIVAEAEALSREDIPLPGIDVIVAGDIIEHLSNPGAMLETTSALSDPETVLVVTTPNAMGLPNFARHALGRWADGPDHVCAFNEFTLRNLLRRHGWVIHALYTCYQPRARLQNARFLFWLGQHTLRAVPRLGGTLFAMAKRATSTARPS